MTPGQLLRKSFPARAALKSSSEQTVVLQVAGVLDINVKNWIVQ
jgi:hypothetical protein